MNTLKGLAQPHQELGKWKLKPQKYATMHTPEWLKFKMTNVARMWNSGNFPKLLVGV